MTRIQRELTIFLLAWLTNISIILGVESPLLAGLLTSVVPLLYSFLYLSIQSALNRKE